MAYSGWLQIDVFPFLIGKVLTIAAILLSRNFKLFPFLIGKVLTTEFKP